MIGKSDAGKSTLINAIHKALSFVFKKGLELNRQIRFVFPHINIKAEGSFYDQTLRWEMYAATSTFGIQHPDTKMELINSLAFLKNK